MLLSRFWYLLLSVVVGVLLTVLVMAQSALTRQLDRHLEDQLRRDRYEVELVLRDLARSQIDAISGVAGDSEVQKTLREISAGRGQLQRRHATLGSRLQILNEKLEEFAGDLLFAVDKRGSIVGAVGVRTVPEGASLNGYPLVRKALQGYLRDDTWLWNDDVYRMAARPVVSDGVYIGAVVHGMKIDNAFAERLSERIPGATIGFFVGRKVIASHVLESAWAISTEDLAVPLGEALENPNLKNGDRTQATNLPSANAQAIYSLVTGSAGDANVGYALARTTHAKEGNDSILALLDFQKDEGTSSLLSMALPVIFLSFLIAWALLFLEHDRPSKRFLQQAMALASGAAARFNAADFGGRFRKAAEACNEAMDKLHDASGGPKPADLDEVLGAAEAKQAPSFFGFAEREDDVSSMIPPAPPPPSDPGSGALRTSSEPPRAPVPASERPAAHESAPPAPSVAPTPVPPAPPAQASVPPELPAVPAPPVPPPGAIPTPVAPSPDGALLDARDSSPQLASQGPGPVAAGATPPPPAAEGDTSPPPEPEVSKLLSDLPAEEGQTLVKQIPQELLDAVSTGRATGEVDEDTHFRQVFEDFVATKQRCGESTAGLTFDKFKRTLEKNRRQIVTRHGASRVRFTVYEKAGKAALKATPIK